MTNNRLSHYGPDAEMIGPRNQGIGNIGAERQIGVVMPADFPSVDEDRTVPAHRAEVQEDSGAAPAVGDGKFPLADHFGPGMVPDAGEEGFGTEGHKDGAVPEAPASVQAEPVLPPQLGPRVAGPGDVRQAQAFFRTEFLHDDGTFHDQVRRWREPCCSRPA